MLTVLHLLVFAVLFAGEETLHKTDVAVPIGCETFAGARALSPLKNHRGSVTAPMPDTPC